MSITKKMFRIFGYCVEALKYILLYPIAKFCYRNREIRIFAERGTDARDNAFHLYRFYRQMHPELESYYVIAKKSADRPKVEKLGNVITHGSLRHYLVFMAAKYKISTHIMGYSPNTDFYVKFSNKLRVKGHRIFLQHGVISNDLPMLYADKTHLNIFICGAKPEYDFISETFGYHNQEVKYTGLARYDALHDTQLKRQILCMPTWRRYLKYDSTINLGQSDYVVKWNSLINNPKLISALRENNLTLVFYPHYEMQENISLFKSASEEVVIANFEDYDVQQLLKESRLLVTDFSSVFYDFAYMNKPILYYQFDKGRYYGDHYAKGYFEYETMGFGEVIEQEDDAVEAILSYINSHFEMPSDYKKRISAFFPLHDSQNCQRIFNEIESL